jgi:lipopolysaccharide transport system ATP-binding protein
MSMSVKRIKRKTISIMATAIEFDHVSKQYRLGLVSTKTLSHDIRRWWLTSVRGKEDPYLKIGETNDRATKGSSEYVWALRDIDFKVEQGDVVGIIGKNGAGKSTLLKLLSRVTGPTTGTIRAHGRIGSLLEVGTGFHGEMTGRENIFMNGAILGMSRAEIQSKLDEIIDFSGCERYIDTPVKRYSSGMTVRLGFAVAAFLEPEILVVDEVLAVGDAEFQKKAIGKMKDVSQGQGRTVLFVSHNMQSMQRLCTRGVLLEKGMVKYMGTISDTISTYLTTELRQNQYTKTILDPSQKLELLSAEVKPSVGNACFTSVPLDVRMVVRVNKPIRQIVIGFNVLSAHKNPLARVDYNDFNGLSTLPIGTYEFNFRIPEYTFSSGSYSIVFDVAERDVENYAKEDTVLTFEMAIEENSSLNLFNESHPLKVSIIRERWLKDYTKID